MNTHRFLALASAFALSIAGPIPVTVSRHERYPLDTRLTARQHRRLQRKSGKASHR